MHFVDLYESGSHRKNLAHFATLASLAAADGVVNEKEKAILDKFAFKLDITEEEYEEVMKKENRYPIDPAVTSEKRLQRLFDFFQIIFSDHEIDDEECALVKRYALGLGCTTEQSEKIIKKSVKIFSGKISFEDYHYLIESDN